ncbi:ubiquitin-conjugating enzyme E2-binding protein [Aspergillus pseudodeflectus]|uniref:Ubiquitin-conjugating enzyme E2-binding protein n=1 Tax=Aspergillus pseudodeflectus TaxID=176178 RepID=A0ABR4JFN1_9EURO
MLSPTAEHESFKSNPEPSLTLHAEYLPNIRQVSLQISVEAPTNADAELEISLSESGKSVSVSLPGYDDGAGGLSETLKLPVKVGQGAKRVLNAHTNGRLNGHTTTALNANNFGDNGSLRIREFSYRMPVDEEDVQRSALDEVMDAFVPWAAGDMDPYTKLRCRKCESILLDVPELGTAVASPTGESQSAGWTWKDLPSGNWAEMMDFWHCHKPDEHEHDDDAAAKQSAENENSKVKGYGASNQVLASSGTVLVDVATFLVSDRDCKGLKKKVSKGYSGEELLCEGCGTLIGVEDAIAQGWRLFKTSLSAGFPVAEGPSEVKWESHSPDLVVAAQLLELIERESARRFIIHCGKKNGLLLWVFNPDMRYSSTGTGYSITPQRAIKAFFQTTDNVDDLLHPEPGKTSSLSLEELRLPPDTFTAFFHALENSNSRLPQSARKFQRDWSVGILHRHERVKPT